MQRNIIQRGILGGGRILRFEVLSQAEAAHFDSLGSVGGKVWPCADHLVDYMESNLNLVRSKRVLELGSGCGYTGVALGALGARSVTLTDMLLSQKRMEYDMEGCLIEGDASDPNGILLDLCSRNIQLNKDHLEGCDMSVAELEWGQQNVGALCTLMEKRTDFDLIIGTDLTYYQDATEALFWTVSRILQLSRNTISDDCLDDSSSNGNCKFIAAHQKRRENTAAVAIKCAANENLNCKVMTEDDDFLIWEFSAK